MILLILISLILGVSVPFLARRIIANYPGTWADVVCGKNKGRIEKINWATLTIIPLLSIAILGFISALYPFILPGAQWALVGIIFIGFLTSIIDWKFRIIPDILIFPLMLIAVFLADAAPWMHGGIMEGVIAGVCGYVLPNIIGVLLYKKSDEAIGGGDIKLMCVGGLFLGVKLLALTLVIAAALSIVWKVIQSFKTKEQVDFIPFAPFFWVGAWWAIVINVLM
jgi:prepilin signal peptidase PulO-like enzyme (type II secretory pathway)